jgi:hypothetical protein
MNPMLKRSRPQAAPDAMQETANGETQFRDNPRVNASIDDWIKNNPKRWDYIKAMPRDRMERAMVLHEVQKVERQQKMNDGILRRLEQNPEAKQAYEALVKDLPEDQREKAMISIARQAMRVTAPRQAQSQGALKV